MAQIYSYRSPKKDLSFWQEQVGKKIQINKKPDLWADGGRKAECPLDLVYPINGVIEGAEKHNVLPEQAVIFVKKNGILYGFSAMHISDFNIIEGEHLGYRSKENDPEYWNNLKGRKIKILEYNNGWSSKHIDGIKGEYPGDLSYPVTGTVLGAKFIEADGSHNPIHIEIDGKIYSYALNMPPTYELLEEKKMEQKSKSDILKEAKEKFRPETQFRDLVHNLIWSVKLKPVDTFTFMNDGSLYVSVHPAHSKSNRSARIYRDGVWAKTITSKPEPEPQFKVGDWVITKGWTRDYDGHPLRINRIDRDEFCYFDYYGLYSGNDTDHNFGLQRISRHATHEEIKKCLVDECNRRGLSKKGSYLYGVDGNSKFEINKEDGIFQYFELGDKLWYEQYLIYSKGNWASILEQKKEEPSIDCKFKVGDTIIHTLSPEYGQAIITKIEDNIIHYNGFDGEPKFNTKAFKLYSIFAKALKIVSRPDSSVDTKKAPKIFDSKGGEPDWTSAILGIDTANNNDHYVDASVYALYGLPSSHHGTGRAMYNSTTPSEEAIKTLHDAMHGNISPAELKPITPKTFKQKLFGSKEKPEIKRSKIIKKEIAEPIKKRIFNVEIKKSKLT